MQLVPCRECDRHVAVTEQVCPFCSAPFTAEAPRPSRLGRASRAAVFAGAASAALATGACGGKKQPDTLGNDTNTAAAPDAEPAPPPPPPNDTNLPMPYGAPPARKRVV
jgi:hypothetical protein